MTKLCAVLLIMCITAVNCAGIKESALLSVALTSTKVLLVLSVFVLALFYMALPSGSTEQAMQNLSPTASFEGSTGILGFGSGLVAVRRRTASDTRFLPPSHPSHNY